MQTQERWQRVRELFAQLLAVPAAERRAWLQRTCGDDEALRDELTSLLEAHDGAGSFLELGGGEPGGDETAQADPLRGQRIGPYRLVRRLGAGGMGVVYLAVRADREFEKRVALKILRSALLSQRAVERFRVERQILAALDHPRIARLLDGGSMPDTSPYLVMEFVEGEPLDRYCDRRRLPVEQRLDLFRQVCSAVHFAHQNLVIHRDLKPANVLVAEGGKVKLLDFGIAKLVNPELAPGGAAPTATLMQMMTPEYASPEQLAGRSVSTASDVYSLGVVLHELLTGRLPRPRGKDTGGSEGDWQLPSQLVLQPPAAEAVDGPRASSSRAGDTGASGAGTSTREALSARRGVTPAKLQRLLAGDLDNILLTALRREPHRRYGSAEQLADDLRDHLRGRPVSARPDTVAYRLGKFVRRHRVAVVAVAAFLVACIAFGAVMAVQRSQIARERDLAEVSRREAEQVTRFLVDLFEASDPDLVPGSELTARQILDRGARQVDDALGGRPLVRARLLQTIGQAYHKLGRYDEARSLLQQALENQQQLLGREARAVGESLQRLGNLEVDLGDYDAARQHLTRSLAIHQKTLGPEDLGVAEVLRDLAVLEANHGQRPRAEQLARRSLVLRERLAETPPVELVDSLNLLAVLLKDQGRYDEAEPLFRRALEVGERNLGPEHSKLAATLNNLANLYRYQGRNAQAEPLLTRALELTERIFGARHPRVGIACGSLANLYQDQQRYDEAEALYRRSSEIFSASLPADHPYLGMTLNNLAELYQRQGKTEEAAERFLDAEGILRRTLGPEHPMLYGIERGLALVERDRGNMDAAQRHFLRAEELAEQLRPEVLAEVLEDHAALLESLGRTEEARGLASRAAGLRGESP